MKDWKTIIWQPSKERIEPIDADSLSDAFEVADDEIEKLFIELLNK